MKNRKPKSFGFYYLKHGLIFLALWVFLCYGALIIFYYYSEKKFEQAAMQDYYSCKESILQSVKNDTMARRQAALTLFLPHGNTRNDCDCTAMSYIVDQETGETVGYTNWCRDEYVVFYLFEKDKEGLNHRISGERAEYYEKAYYCSKEILREYLGDLKERIQTWENIKLGGENSSGKKLSVLIESFYHKDANFLPGRISIRYENRNSPGVLKEQELLETITYVPEHNEDYELIEVDEEKEWVYGNLNDLYADNPEIRNWEIECLKRAQGLEAQIDYSDVNATYDPYRRSHSRETFLFLPKRFAIVREFLFTDVTGHVYKGVFYFENNMIETYRYGMYHILNYVIIFAIICFGGSFLFAESEYRKKRYAYATEGYRNALVDSMAHDLKSPLMVISGYAENLKENLEEQNLEKTGYYAKKIYDNIGYVNQLVTENLEILRLDRGKIIRKKVDFRKLFAEAFERYREELENRKLTVKMEGEMLVKGDEKMLQRVADNLVTNCVRHASEGGEISLLFSKRKLVIQNPASLTYKGDLKKLWEPFVKGDESRGGRSSGLGLSIVANALECHSWKRTLRYEKETKLFICMIKIPFGL